MPLKNTPVLQKRRKFSEYCILFKSLFRFFLFSYLEFVFFLLFFHLLEACFPPILPFFLVFMPAMEAVGGQPRSFRQK